MKTTETDTPPPGKCGKCAAPVTGDHYCFGCKQYICAACDLNWRAVFPIQGAHEISRHWNPILAAAIPLPERDPKADALGRTLYDRYVAACQIGNCSVDDWDDMDDQWQDWIHMAQFLLTEGWRP